MRKYILIIFILFILACYNTYPFNIFAKQEFLISLDNVYSFTDNGLCIVKEGFTIENLITEKYLPSFEYRINNAEIKNIKVYSGEDEIVPQVNIEDTYINIKILFKDKVLGKGNKRSFTINYEVDNLAIRTGDVWELSIPKIDDLRLYENIKSTLIIPKTFGSQAYITPDYKNKTEAENEYIYIYEKDELKPSRIVAGFGEYQTFSYTINYHLINNNNKKSTEEISIPPDTSYQRIFIDSIKPEPLTVYKDKDDNWIAQYQLDTNQEIDISINGKAQIFSSPRVYLVPRTRGLYENIRPTKYWNTDDNKIVEVSKSLEDPQAIYNYVINKLEYDYELQPGDRLGSSVALLTEKKVSCREYSDLMITLLRAKGIPAREVVGYAHTDNKSVKPTEFFNDILHSWVEYWDTDNNYWISVDPTWGDTSATDYFNQFDLRHFAFTIHGSSDEIPNPPGFYKNKGDKKDILVNIAGIDNYKETKLEFKHINNILFSFNRNYLINIENRNHTALYDKNIKYYGDNKFLGEDNLDIILPYSKTKKSLNIDYSFFARKTPNLIMILTNGNDSYISGPKHLDIYTHLTLTFALLILLFLFLIKKMIKSSHNTHV